MLISDKTKDLPKRIGSFSMITERFLDVDLDTTALQKHFDKIEKGSLVEVLVSYDNFNYRYSIRIRERKEKLFLQFEFMEIFSDHIGPLSATTLKEERYVGDLEDVFESFLKWIKSTETDRNKW